ncbi:MAG: endonuclease domain-containing protein [Bacteroidia bacterium]|nr:endonuclease domain-containing protein [Bacteroidia bacterium]
MSLNKIISYNPYLKELARQLRKNSTLSEILLWQKIKGKSFGFEFHRQVPLSDYIVDFYCHELMLAIEIDGCTHDHKYEYDANRQSKLERLGVKFIRFSDIDVKRNMNDVLRALEIVIIEIEEC